MVASMKPLQDEHRELHPFIEQLRTTADAIGDRPDSDVEQRVQGCVEFLEHHLLPHARAEDAVLYPAVERAMGARGATATMRRDHVEVEHLTRELGELRFEMPSGIDDKLARNLRRVLYGLYALVSVHFAKEEEVYVPLLADHLTSADADAMFEAMHRASLWATSKG